MGLDKYACFMQMYVYYYCNNPKQWQILSRIFSRITSKVLHAVLSQGLFLLAIHNITAASLSDFPIYGGVRELRFKKIGIKWH